ncbi:hypothetical protein EG329_012764 [Mollisiaceae sp. DMI_Dod_QoI]|nr:hypothetical protein EG329_012764 [Helotiales sp. DMI_Dod_QoI]
MSSSPTPVVGQDLLLLSLPQELLLKICTLACKHSSAIHPELWLPDSSKFAHLAPMTTMRTGFQLRGTARIEGYLDEALTVVDFGSSCKAIHNIIDGNNLFYKVNIFEFTSFETMLHYLKALLPRRRHAIRNVNILYDALQGPEPALTVLSSLESLKYLTLDITMLAKYLIGGVTHFSRCPGFRKLTELRGLKTLTLTYGEDEDWNLLHTVLFHRRVLLTDANEDAVRFEIAGLEASLNAMVKLPRTLASNPTPGDLALAMSHSHVTERGTAKTAIISRSTSAPVISNTSSTWNKFITWELSSSDDWSSFHEPSPWDAGGEWAADYTPRGWFQQRTPARRHSI